MSKEENKAIARRYFEDAWNNRNLAVLDEVVAPAFVGHATDKTIQGIEGLKKRVREGLSEFSNIHFTIDDVIAEGDKVCVRWSYRTGKADIIKKFTGMHFLRIASGKIEEFWVNINDLDEK